MALKMTTYSLGFEGDSKHDKLIMMGSWGDEKDAHAALCDAMGWDAVFLSTIFQMSFEVAAFAAFPTSEARDAAVPPFVGAPRIFQHNALVVPA